MPEPDSSNPPPAAAGMAKADPSAVASAAKADGRDRRLLGCWGAALGLLGALGLFCWLVVAPYVQVRREVISLWVLRAQTCGGYAAFPKETKDSVERLGGPSEALPKIRLYLRLPKRVAPAKDLATMLLGQCGEPAVDPLMEALCYRYGNSPEDSVAAACALAQVGPPAGKAAPLLTSYAVAPTSDRNAYCYALRKVDPEGTQAVPMLIGLLGNQDADIRSGAIHVLGRFGPAAKPAVPLIVKALDDPATARAAARALVFLGPDAKEAVPALVKALGSDYGLVRRDAVWALGRIGPDARQAAPALVGMFEKDKPPLFWSETQFLAGLVLGRIGDRSTAREMVAALEGFNSDNHPFAESLAMIGPEAVPEMVQIKDVDCGLEVIADALGRMGPEAREAVPWLIRQLQRKEVTFAKPSLVVALGGIGPAAKEAVPALAEVLKDTSEFTRREAATALGCIGPEAKAALPALDGLASDADEGVRLIAAAAAFKIRGEPDKAVAILVAGLASDKTCAEASRELGLLGPAAREAGPELAKHMPYSAVAYWRVTGDAAAARSSLVMLLYQEKPGSALSLLSQMGADAKPALELMKKVEGRPPFAEPWGKFHLVRAFWKIRGIDEPPGEDEWWFR